MPRNVVGQIPPQTTSSRYLQKANLQRLLERLFPGQTEFGIQVTRLEPVHRAQG